MVNIKNITTAIISSPYFLGEMSDSETRTKLLSNPIRYYCIRQRSDKEIVVSYLDYKNRNLVDREFYFDAKVLFLLR